MTKKTLRTTVAQAAEPILAEPARDRSALILPISVIKLGDNVRSALGDLTELTDSIRVHGVLQPLVVAKTGRGLELVAGFRRYHAAKEAGLADVPVRVIGVNESQIAILRLVENVVRENLSGADEIRAVAKLSIMFPDQVQLAAALGKSKTYVSRCLKAAALVETDRVATSQLSKSALFEIADKADPVNALNEITKAEKPTVQSARQAGGRRSSGPLGGGRYVENAVAYRENERTKAWSLRVNYDPERTPPTTRDELIKKLQEILKRLKEQNAE